MKIRDPQSETTVIDTSESDDDGNQISVTSSFIIVALEYSKQGEREREWLDMVHALITHSWRCIAGW